MNDLKLGIVVLLFIIILLLFNRSRVKKIMEEQLEFLQQQLVTKNQLLELMIGEKEWLLKEVHHRVKNNLQTVVSLLESQSAYLKNSEALSAIQDSQNRVHAMSLIHQKLYRSDSLGGIDLSMYISDLVQHLRESFDVQNKIIFELKITRIQIDVSQAIPLALIVNEAITNSVKYGFVNGPGNNMITVIIEQVDEKATLKIFDNGQGMPADFDIDSDQCGLGLKLMKGLAEDIDAEFVIRSEQGVKITIIFIPIMPLPMTASMHHS